MCGIVGAVAKNDVVPLLFEGLKRLEYRGYDSAGIAVIVEGELQRLRAEGKIANLAAKQASQPLASTIGIAHTRWSTHGEATERNAHPFITDDRLALVHNGIIENYAGLKQGFIDQGIKFSSDTDSEVANVCIVDYLKQGAELRQAVSKARAKLQGNYALCVIDKTEPNRMIALCHGSPIVVGFSEHGRYIASDNLALQSVADGFIYLENGDLVDINGMDVQVFDSELQPINRTFYQKTTTNYVVSKGKFSHYMLKEIFEQQEMLLKFSQNLKTQMLRNDTLKYGPNAAKIFKQARAIYLVACGTSYHAGFIAKYWFEQYLNIPCQVEVASEFRYRHKVILPDSLLICLSQSGETADTLAALRSTKDQAEFIGRLSICNVFESSLRRESELFDLINAGPEIGVCSTKAFSAQLSALMYLLVHLKELREYQTSINPQLIQAMTDLPKYVQPALDLSQAVQNLAVSFQDKRHALFIGRGIYYPVALEGALKLKEISYIHAEAFPAGELKHGPLALVDKHVMVVVIAPSDELLDKVKMNIEEVKARGAKLLILCDEEFGPHDPSNTYLCLPKIADFNGPIVYSIVLQLLAFYVAKIKGTDIDQPRNLAKSVTVE